MSKPIRSSNRHRSHVRRWNPVSSRDPFSNLELSSATGVELRPHDSVVCSCDLLGVYTGRLSAGQSVRVNMTLQVERFLDHWHTCLSWFCWQRTFVIRQLSLQFGRFSCLILCHFNVFSSMSILIVILTLNVKSWVPSCDNIYWHFAMSCRDRSVNVFSAIWQILTKFQIRLIRHFCCRRLFFRHNLTDASCCWNISVCEFQQ